VAGGVGWTLTHMRRSGRIQPLTWSGTGAICVASASDALAGRRPRRPAELPVQIDAIGALPKLFDQICHSALHRQHAATAAVALLAAGLTFLGVNHLAAVTPFVASPGEPRPGTRLSSIRAPHFKMTPGVFAGLVDRVVAVRAGVDAGAVGHRPPERRLGPCGRCLVGVRLVRIGISRKYSQHRTNCDSGE
jgi:hypothetical protein